MGLYMYILNLMTKFKRKMSKKSPGNIWQWLSHLSHLTRSMCQTSKIFNFLQSLKEFHLISPVCNLQPTEVDILYIGSSINWITMKSFGVLFLRSRAVSTQKVVGGAHQRNKIQHHRIWKQSHYVHCTTYIAPAESPVATPEVRILAGQCSVGVGRGRCKTVQNLAPTLPNIGCSCWTLTIAHCPAPAIGSGSVLAQNGMRRGDKTHFSSHHAYCHAQKIVWGYLHKYNILI